MHTQTVERLTHDHAFNQDHKNKAELKTLIVVGLTLVTMAAEIAAGLVYGSMALLADGLHMGSHAAALAITAFAYFYARTNALNERFSFGTGKVNALAGFASALVLGVTALVMVWESTARLFNPRDIAFDQSILVAVVGLIVNAVCAVILNPPGAKHHHDHHDHHGHGRHHHEAHHHHEVHRHGGHGHDHNLRAAYLHIIADAVTSILAIIALLAGKYVGWVWLDPVIGLLGAALILKWAYGLIHDTSAILLDHQAPKTMRDEVFEAIEHGNDDRVADLHLWYIAPATLAGTISIVTDHPRPPEHYKTLIAQHIKIAHLTVEVNVCPHH
jgi:cation diffusion facilitator family transporter